MALTQTEQDALAKLQADIDAVVQAAKGAGGGSGAALEALRQQNDSLTAQVSALTDKLGGEDATIQQFTETVQQQGATIQRLQDAAKAQEQDVTAALGSLDAHVQERGGPPKAGFTGAPPAPDGIGNTGTGPDGAFLGVEAPTDPAPTPAPTPTVDPTPVPSVGDAGAATVAPPDAGAAPVVSPDALVQGASQQVTDAAGNVIDAATGQPISGPPSA